MFYRLGRIHTDAMIDLRDLVPDDSGRLFAWRREPEVNRWMSDQPPETEDARRPPDNRYNRYL